MANRVFAICLVQWLGWVFETQEGQKEKPFQFLNPLHLGQKMLEMVPEPRRVRFKLWVIKSRSCFCHSPRSHIGDSDPDSCCQFPQCVWSAFLVFRKMRFQSVQLDYFRGQVVVFDPLDFCLLRLSFYQLSTSAGRSRHLFTQGDLSRPWSIVFQKSDFSRFQSNFFCKKSTSAGWSHIFFQKSTSAGSSKFFFATLLFPPKSHFFLVFWHQPHMSESCLKWMSQIKHWHIIVTVVGVCEMYIHKYRCVNIHFVVRIYMFLCV